jgi:hypothetical protein
MDSIAVYSCGFNMDNNCIMKWFNNKELNFTSIPANLFEKYNLENQGFKF